MWHIIYRFALHLWIAPGITLSLAFAIRFLRRKTRWEWLPKAPLETVILAGLVVVPIAFFREPFDVGAGQTTTKAVFDFISWICGCVGLSPLAVIKLRQWNEEISRLLKLTQ